MRHAETKDLQEIIDHPTFGPLSKLVVGSIISIGVVISSVIVVARGGDLSAMRDGLEIFTPFLMAAITGGAVNTFGSSETARFIKKNGLPTEVVEAVAPIDGVSLPASHSDIRGNFDNQVGEQPALLSRD